MECVQGTGTIQGAKRRGPGSNPRKRVEGLADTTQRLGDQDYVPRERGFRMAAKAAGEQ